MHAATAGRARGLARRRRSHRLVAACAALSLAVGLAAAPADRPAEIRGLIDQSRYLQAEAEARTLLSKQAKTFGQESQETAHALDLYLEALWIIGPYRDPAARPLAERAVRLKERLFGPESLETATSLMILGGILYELHFLHDAKAAQERSLAIREKLLGPEDPEVSRSLCEVADVVWDLGEPERAGTLYERAAAIAERTLQRQPAALAKRLHALARYVQYTGDPTRARNTEERALALAGKALGPDHPDVAWSKNRLSTVLRDLGEYEKARALEEDALAILQKALGPENAYIGQILDNLGALLWQMGEQQAARQALERSLAIREKAFGPESPDYAVTLGDLGLALYFMGDYKGSRALQERSLAIQERTAGPDSDDAATALNNLALVLIETGEYARAKRLCERAVAIQEKVNGPRSLDFVRSLNTWATALQRAGESEAARTAYERAVATWDRIGGPEPPDKALDLDGLADVLTDLGRPAEARPLYEKALAIRERVFGPEHSAVAVSLNNLADLDWESGDPAGALERSLRAQRTVRREFQQTARSLSEREALAYDFCPVGMRGRLNTRTSAIDVSLSALVSAEAGPLPAGSPAKVWDELARARALVLDEMASRHQSVRRKTSTEVEALRKVLDAARNRLARLVVSGPGAGHPEQYRDRLERAQAEKERAERALAARSAPYRLELARGRVGLQEIREALPAGSALVAYALYGRLSPPRAGAARAAGPSPRIASYLAFVLPAGGGLPSVVPLEGAGEIDGLVRAWRERAGSGGQGLSVAEGREEARYREAGDRLRRAVWDPVAPRLGPARRVFVVPDGTINLVSLAALPSADGRYLVESGPLVHYLSAERDVARSREARSPGRGLLVLGSPDYDAGSGPAVPAAGAVAGAPEEQAAGETPPNPWLAGAGADTALSRASLYRGAGAGCPDLRTLQFRTLPATWVEAEEVAALWSQAAGSPSKSGVLELTGPQAGEAAFKAGVPGRSVVHLATHGFVTPGGCDTASTDNPLLLSGLALAGANRREEARAKDDSNDGILTAEEIASLDLSSADWVVLSACETGIGKVLAGEGVLGLRRAFEVAGAGTLIMSLWPVEDEATREWMKGLYEARLGGSTTAEAVRTASLKVIDARRKAGRSTHPAFWGGFVAAGDWR